MFTTIGFLFGCGEQFDTIEGFPPPETTNEISGNNKFDELTLFTPTTMEGLEAVFSTSKNQNKPALIDFTGYVSVNCRKFEQSVWLSSTIFPLLRDHFIIASLYVDRKQLNVLDTKGNPIQNPVWLNYEQERYNKSTQPVYDIVDFNNVSVVRTTTNSQTHSKPNEFKLWLKEGLNKFKKQTHDQ